MGTTTRGLLLRASLRALVCLLCLSEATRGESGDASFLQAISHKFPIPSEQGEPKQLAIDRDGIVYIRAEAGMLRLFGDRLAPDRTYRPLAGRNPAWISIEQGELYYLFPTEILSNREAGKFVHSLAREFQKFAVNDNREVLLSDDRLLARLRDGTCSDLRIDPPFRVDQVLAVGNRFVCRAGEDLYAVRSNLVYLATLPGLNVLAAHDNKLFAGLTNGLLILDAENGRVVSPLKSRVPSQNVTSLAFSGADIWAGTSKGVWRLTPDGAFRYFASKRWLENDRVIDLQVAPDGDVFILTAHALNEIEFRPMTLAEKALWYEKKIRQRHIRYGFCAELRLGVPGDSTTAEMVDTDNDGTWSNYYMASQAFRFGATGDEQARRNAWETFEALERLESINPLGGFPSRTFERTGFKVSDPERWHGAGDGLWDWKAHTSSDEIIAHMFGSAVLYETTAKSAAEKERIAKFIGRILDHILRNNLYLVDVDGKPTLWARWNPEYVNGFPETMYDRRLNSAEIIAALEFGHAITGKADYKTKAYELMEKAGYLRNITLPMSRIGYTPGFKHQGIEMGMDWNHSDDLLGFVSYWVLYRFAFTDELRRQFAAAIREHWEIEKDERCPLWNFVYASTGATQFGREDALWTLRGFPLDMVDWSVSNSHRGDITRLAPNFRYRELQEVLPPDERRITRWNSQPFVLDGGSGGRTELAGDEFLLPYWMGRYLKVID